jgi:hypothetical protein
LTTLTTLKLAYITTTLPDYSKFVNSASAAGLKVDSTKSGAISSILLPSTLTFINFDSSPGLVQLLASGTQRQCDRKSIRKVQTHVVGINSSCEPMTFRHLRHFHAESSGLRTISPDFALMFHEDARIALTSTSWHCDHRIKWFRDWLWASSYLSLEHVEVNVTNRSKSAENYHQSDMFLSKGTMNDEEDTHPLTASQRDSMREVPSGIASSTFKLYLVQSQNCDSVDSIQYNFSKNRSKFVYPSAARTPVLTTAEQSDLRPIPGLDARFEADNRCSTPRALFGRTLLSLTDDELQTTDNHVKNEVTSSITAVPSRNEMNSYTVCQVHVESHKQSGKYRTSLEAAFSNEYFAVGIYRD